MRRDEQVTTSSSTLEKIRRIAERRQALWSKAPGLTVAEKTEISRLTSELESLWEQHRVALAGRRWGAGRRAASDASARKSTAA
jgi:hypothetical protein